MENTDNLKRLSHYMLIACNSVAAGLVASCAYIAFNWIVDGAAVPMLASQTGANIDNPIQPLSIRFAVIGINAVTLIMVVYGLLSLGRLFAKFRAGELFSYEAALDVRRAGQAFLASALYSILAHTLTVGLLTWNNPPGKRELAIGINSNSLMMVIFAGTLFAVGHALKNATEIETANKEFI